ncbi:hypothetical protein Tco_0743780 [Tanacetum coccineum]
MSWSPQPEPEPELELVDSDTDTPDGSPTWWTRDSERMSPRSPNCGMGLPLQEAEEASPVADPYVGGDQSGCGGVGNNDDSDEGASIPRESLSGSRVSSPVAEISSPHYGGGGNRVASPIAEISRPQLLPASAVGGDGIYGGGNDDINMIDVCPICYEPWTNDGGHRTWVNERQIQTTEEKTDTSNASSVIIESNGTESKEQDTSSRSGNDAHVDDADIRPIYAEEPMAEVQMTADDNVSATGQQHTEQLEFINEGEVDQNAAQCHDTCPLPAKLTDDKTTELSNQLLESEYGLQINYIKMWIY